MGRAQNNPALPAGEGLGVRAASSPWYVFSVGGLGLPPSQGGMKGGRLFRVSCLRSGALATRPPPTPPCEGGGRSAAPER
jgi:hypothetical protein